MNPIFSFIIRIFYYELKCSYCGKIFYESSKNDSYQQCCSYNCGINAIASAIKQNEIDEID